MSGPWEKYAVQKPAEDGPWSKYARTDSEVLTDVFGSEGAAEHAMTGNNVPPPEVFFENPNTGQMTSREIMRDAIQHGPDAIGRGEAAANTAAHGATLGTTDEAAWLAGRTDSPEMARFMQEQQRAKIEAARGRYPIQSFTTEAGGGMVVPGTILNETRKASTVGQAVKQSAKGGAGVGTAYAIGEGEGHDRYMHIPQYGAAGAVGGVVAVPVGKAVLWAGRNLGKPVARLFADRRYYQEGMGLTPAGRAALEAIGYNADEVTAAFQREFSEGVAEGIPAEQAARAAEMTEFGIPAFKHNVTGEVNDAADFHRAVRGGAGSQAAGKTGAAYQGQLTASRQAADDVATNLSDGVRGDQLDAAEGVVHRLDSIKASEKAAAKAAYDASDAAGVAFDPQVASGVTSRIETKLADSEIDTTLKIYKTANAYLSRLRKRGEGDKPVSLKLIDELRKDLNADLGSAKGPDRRALTIIKKEYDQWVDDVVEAKLFTGDEAGVDELKKARALWQKYASKYQGKDAGSKFIRDMIDQDADPAKVVNWLFGSSKLGGGRMNSKLAARLRSTLGPKSDEWNMVRQAAFRKVVQKAGTENVAGGGVIPWGPQKVSQNVFDFLDSPSTRPFANVLFTGPERATMRRFASAVNRMVPPDGAVNYSGTAYEGSRMVQKAWEAMAGTVGFLKGGPVGAIAAREGAKAGSGGASWLKGRSLTAKPKGKRPIGAPAPGAIAAGQTTGMFPEPEERAYPR